MFSKAWYTRALVAAGALAVAAAPAAGQAATGTTFRVSLTAAGGQTDGRAYWPSISADGSTVLFGSDGTGTAPSCPNPSRTEAVFVRDLVHHTTECVSVDAAGHQATSWALPAAVSADGSRVLFISGAANLPGALPIESAYLRDRRTSGTTQINLDQTGRPFDTDCGIPTISADGSTAAIYGEPAPGTDLRTLYLRNLDTGVVTTVADARFVSCDAFPALSRDGGIVVYRGVVGKVWGLWRLDRATGGAALVNRDGSDPTVSGDGGEVTFTARAPQVPADTNGTQDVYVTRFAGDTRGATQLVSRRTTGTVGNRASTSGRISPDGRYVAFTSDATNLVPGDTNRATDVFVRDMVKGTTARVDVTSAGTQVVRAGVGTSPNWPSVTSDGTGKPVVAFPSMASDLIPSDTNGTDDIFIRR